MTIRGWLGVKQKLYICPSIYLSVCLSGWLAGWLSFCPSFCLSVCLPVCLSIYLPTYLPTYLSQPWFQVYIYTYPYSHARPTASANSKYVQGQRFGSEDRVHWKKEGGGKGQVPVKMISVCVQKTAIPHIPTAGIWPLGLGLYSLVWLLAEAISITISNTIDSHCRVFSYCAIPKWCFQAPAACLN